MTFQPNNKEIVQVLDNLVGERYSKEHLERKLTEFFKVTIELELEYREECDYSDDAFLFVIENICDATIYFIKDKLGMYYITENNVDFNF